MCVNCFKPYQLMYLKKQTVWQIKIRASILIDILVYYVLANSLLRRERLHRVYCFVTYFAHTVHTIIYIHVQAIGYSMMTSIYIKFLLFVEKLRRKRCVSYCRIYMCSVHTTALPCTIDIALYNSVLYWWLTLTCYIDILSHQWLSINSYFYHPLSFFPLLTRERERERERGLEDQDNKQSSILTKDPST